LKGRFHGQWAAYPRELLRERNELRGEKSEAAHIRDGCKLILGVVQAFSAPRSLADGLTEFDFITLATFETLIAEPKLDQENKSESIGWPSPEDEIWAEFETLAELLSERQLAVARRYTFPKWVKGKASATLHKLGSELNVTHATIAKDDERITSMVQDLIKRLKLDEKLIDFAIFQKFLENVIEIGWNGHPSV